MKRPDTDLEPELAALLEFPDVERQAPADVRERALARARASVAAGGAIPLAAAGGATPPAALLARPRPVPVDAGRGLGLLRVAAVASIALVAGAVGAVVALRSRAPTMPAVAELARSRPPPSIRGDGVHDPLDVSSAVAMPRAAASKTAHLPRSAHVADPYTAELELLQRAQAAYTRRDFPEALALVAEHTRRFPKGHLAEERDALGVRSLVGMGRAGEAKSAAANFAARFPRSVLLPRVQEALDDLH